MNKMENSHLTCEINALVSETIDFHLNITFFLNCTATFLKAVSLPTDPTGGKSVF